MILIMCHTKFSEMLLTSIFSKLSYKIISVPHQTAFLPPENHISLMQEAIRQKNSEDEINYILLESNYGSPAEAVINQPLFDRILTDYNNAKIIAFSSTTDSLVKALAYDSRICAMCKDPYIVNEVAAKSGLVDDASISGRIITVGDLKKMLDPNKRVSVPPIIAPLDDNQTSFSPTRNRSASLPATFTPSFDAYYDTSALGYTSTATTTTTNHIQETSHGNNLNFKTN